MTNSYETSWLANLSEKLITGAISGIIGGSLTFPLDTIKTLLQNAPKSQYTTPVNMIRDLWAREGIRGYYKGLPAVIVGITPEKAIKLGVNDFMGEVFRRHLDVPILSLPYLVMSGAIAGSMQVIATNPMEVVKIQMQVSTRGNMVEKNSQPSYGQVLKQLGFTGLYKGVTATLLRDVPFSMIYFSGYGWMRQKLMDNDGQLSMAHAFGSGLVSGAFASGLVTPADVIKTRLQAPSSHGTIPYNGKVWSTAMRIVNEEGFMALYRGAIPRMLVISPLFAISLAIYEFQKTLLFKT